MASNMFVIRLLFQQRIAYSFFCAALTFTPNKLVSFDEVIRKLELLYYPNIYTDVCVYVLNLLHVGSMGWRPLCTDLMRLPFLFASNISCLFEKK